MLLAGTALMATERPGPPAEAVSTRTEGMDDREEEVFLFNLRLEQRTLSSAFPVPDDNYTSPLATTTTPHGE